jgi:hypothetical protein
MRRLKLKTLRAGLGPIGAEVEVTQSERDVLHPLFVTLRDKRALLHASHGRADSEYVTRSIELIREELTSALKALGPDSAVARWIENMRNACREYLDAVAEARHRTDPGTDFTLALGQLRRSFREVAELVDSQYDLPSARELIDEMDRADEAFSDPDERSAGSIRDESIAEKPLSATSEAPGVAAAAPKASSGSDDRLVEALGDRDTMVRFTAMTALRNHLHPGLLPVIEPLLKDRDNDIRRYAVEYYAELHA